jgi:hypothetical protein
MQTLTNILEFIAAEIGFLMIMFIAHDIFGKYWRKIVVAMVVLPAMGLLIFK